MSILEQLNDRQKEAAACIDRHVRIIAGAGSGKTRVVTTRIAYLIDECHVYPNKILAITFTNKAAREMKERVENMLGPIARSVQISTIHSFCVRLLREDIRELGYPRNFTILDSEDQKSILKEIYKEKGIDTKVYSYPSMLGYISACKTVFVSPAQAQDAAQFEGQKIKAEVYGAYQKRLEDMYALDFDDLLLQAHRLLKESREIREKWQRRFTYIHVDEFQDVDELQYDIIRLLCAEHTKLCVVGDPDQTIYTWRGAKVDIILDFEKDFPDCRTVILNENYRSEEHILKGANAVIKNNRNRIDKDLYTSRQSSQRIIHFSAADEQNEPVWVAAKIKTLHHGGTAYRDIAVLYRSNYLSRGLEKALLSAHIPYRIYGGIRFYERAEIKDALSYLRLLGAKQEDDPKEMWKSLAVRRVLNVPKRGIGAKSIEQLEEQAKEEAAYEEKKTAEPRKAMGFITVSIGAGMNEIFKELGADYIIEGGQTMNPSTEDMLNAIDQVNADTVFILPNNKNIILAANQAKSLVEDKEIIVIPTKTVPQGITAIINFMPDADAKTNEEAMLEEIKNVKTGQMTYAVRDTHIDDKEIHEGDIMGIGDSGILAVGKDLEETTKELIANLVDEDSELISIYYGEEVSEEEAEKFAGEIEELYPDVDVDIQFGGQPIYYYVLAVE